MKSFQPQKIALGKLDLQLLQDILLAWSGERAPDDQIKEAQCLARELVDLFVRGPGQNPRSDRTPEVRQEIKPPSRQLRDQD
jgi:hypothetical protein